MHAFGMHFLSLQIGFSAGQASFSMHSTQAPSPSQTAPPLSSQGELADAFVTTHFSSLHSTSLHFVAVAGHGISPEHSPIEPPAELVDELDAGPLAPAPEGSLNWKALKSWVQLTATADTVSMPRAQLRQANVME
jgi:hypothetical protein